MDGFQGGDVITYDSTVDLSCLHFVETYCPWSSYVVYISKTIA